MKDKLIALLGFLAMGFLALFSLEKAGRAKDKQKQAEDEAEEATKLQEAYAKGEQEQNETIKEIHNTRNKRGHFTK